MSRSSPRPRASSSPPQTGVSTVAFYDPPGRVVATLHPDSSWAKAVFGPWAEQQWDGNDTVLVADPRTDPDVGNYFQRLLGTGPFTSWYELRITGTYGATAQDRAAAQDAAQKAAAHAATPAVSHRDSAGRVCLAVADNGGGARYPTRTAYDTQGQPLAITDPLGRRTQEYVYRDPQPGGGFQYLAGSDLAGQALYQVNADGGARRGLTERRRSADPDLGRARPRVPPRLRSGPAPDPPLRQHRRRRRDPHRPLGLRRRAGRRRTCAAARSGHYDMSGFTENSRYDYAGNLISSVRQLAADYHQAVDWTPLASLTAAAQLDAAAAAAGLVPAGDGGRDGSPRRRRSTR